MYWWFVLRSNTGMMQDAWTVSRCLNVCSDMHVGCYSDANMIAAECMHGLMIYDHVWCKTSYSTHELLFLFIDIVHFKNKMKQQPRLVKMMLFVEGMNYLLEHIIRIFNL